MIWNYANLNIKFLIKFVMAAFQIVVSKQYSTFKKLIANVNNVIN